MSVTTRFHSVTFSTTLGRTSEKRSVQLFQATPYTYEMEPYLDGVSVCMQSSPRVQGGEEAVAGDGEVGGERKRKVLVSLHKIIHLSYSEERIPMSVK